MRNAKERKIAILQTVFYVRYKNDNWVGFGQRKINLKIAH
jgi:hypothetical protein